MAIIVIYILIIARIYGISIGRSIGISLISAVFITIVMGFFSFAFFGFFLSSLRSNLRSNTPNSTTVINGVVTHHAVTNTGVTQIIDNANDTTMQNVTVEYAQALQSYISTKGGLPWNVDPSGNCTLSSLGTGSVSTSSISDCTTDLISDGDLPFSSSQYYGSGTTLGKIFISPNSALKNAVWVCYLPTSQSFETQASTNFTKNGQTAPAGNNCGTAKASDCYWCTQGN